MSEVCSICRKPAAGVYEIESGSIGHTCADRECGSLLWEQHLNETFGATTEERARIKWRIASKRQTQPAYVSTWAKRVDSEVAKADVRLFEIVSESEVFGVDLGLDTHEASQLSQIVESTK